MLPFEVGLSQTNAELIRSKIPPQVEHLELSLTRDLSGYVRMGLEPPTGIGLNFSKTYRSLCGVPHQVLEDQATGMKRALQQAKEDEVDPARLVAVAVDAHNAAIPSSAPHRRDLPSDTPGLNLRHVQIRMPAIVQGTYNWRETAFELGDNSIGIKQMSKRPELKPFLVQAPPLKTRGAYWDEEDTVLREHFKRTRAKGGANEHHYFNNMSLLQEAQEQRSADDSKYLRNGDRAWGQPENPSSLADLSFHLVPPEEPIDAVVTPKVRQRGEPDLWNAAVKAAFHEAGLLWA